MRRIERRTRWWAPVRLECRQCGAVHETTASDKPKWEIVSMTEIFPYFECPDCGFPLPARLVEGEQPYMRIQ